MPHPFQYFVTISTSIIFSVSTQVGYITPLKLTCPCFWKVPSNVTVSISELCLMNQIYITWCTVSLFRLHYYKSGRRFWEVQDNTWLL
jgi:hypothetical protein